MTDLVDFPLQSKPVYRGMGKAKELADSPIQKEKRFTERPLYLFRGALDRCRIRNTPMRRHRLARPQGTHFFGGVVANRKNKVHLWGIGPRELIPTFAAETTGWDVRDLKLPQGLNANFS